ISIRLNNVPDGTYTINYMDGDPSAQTFTGVIVSSGSALISGLSAGIYNDLSITVAGCSSVEDVDVTLSDPATPIVMAGSDSPQCVGSSLSLTENGGDASSWSWTGPNTFTSTDQNPSISSVTSSAAGRYYVTITDGNSCESVDSVDVVINALPTLILDNTACSVDLTTYSVTVTTTGDAVTASSGSVLDNGGGTWTVSGVDTMDNVIIYASINATSCMDSLVVNKINCACPAIAAPVSGGDVSICVDATIPALSISVSGSDVSSDWYDSNTGGTLLASNTLNYTPAVAGIYYAEARDTLSGCQSATRTPVTLSINALPTIAIGSNSPQFYGSILNLTESGGAAASWSWTGPNTFTSTDQNPSISSVTAAATGRYYVTITDGNSCQNVDSVDVTIVLPIDTIPVIVPVDSTIIVCPDISTLPNPGDLIICDAGDMDATESPNGLCVDITGAIVGNDTICVLVCDLDNPVLCDTTIITITIVPPIDTIPVIVPVDSTIIVCPEGITDLPNPGDLIICDAGDL
ncbi:MAG: hypothetical protein GY746_14245, partial [Gammaproteobacteria bacterium]|nr:hypothetical protein [Gammaproteobacteria bacterium]